VQNVFSNHQSQERSMSTYKYPQQASEYTINVTLVPDPDYTDQEYGMSMSYISETAPGVDLRSELLRSDGQEGHSLTIPCTNQANAAETYDMSDGVLASYTGTSVNLRFSVVGLTPETVEFDVEGAPPTKVKKRRVKIIWEKP